MHAFLFPFRCISLTILTFPFLALDVDVCSVYSKAIAVKFTIKIDSRKSKRRFVYLFIYLFIYFIIFVSENQFTNYIGLINSLP